MVKRSNSNKLLFNFSILLLFLLYPSVKPGTFLYSFKNNHEKQQLPSETKYPSVFPLTEDDKIWIEKMLANMTLREKCAQMIVPWVLGKNYAEDSVGLARMTHLVKDLQVGGLIFSDGDALNEAIDINKAQALSDIPLLISADFESGLGMRLSGGTNFPYNMGLAATRNSDFAVKMGEVVARESKAVGVNQILSPDIDINNNPANPVIGIRSYSEDKKLVSEFGNAFIKGSFFERIITTAKHFPGQGNTLVDSHIDLPIVKGDSLYLLRHEIYPFVQAINTGVQSIMIGHLYLPGLEKHKGLPASLSKSIVTDLLKNKLGFDGLIITDAMNMQAITKYYSVAEAAILAVKAGNDMLLMPPDEEIAINSLVSAVQSCEIDIQRINTSVIKILAAKRWLKLQENRFTNVDKISENIGTEQNLKLAQDIADRSITLVKNTRKVIPLNPEKYHSVVSVAFSFGIPDDSVLVFQSLVSDNFKNSSIFILNKNSGENEFNKVLKYARRADLILLPYFMRPPSDKDSEKLFTRFKRVINKLLVARPRTILISFGDPYLLSHFTESKTYLSAFSDVPVSQISMMKAIMGKINISGKLPVSLPNTPFKIGYGIKTKRSN